MAPASSVPGCQATALLVWFISINNSFFLSHQINTSHLAVFLSHNKSAPATNQPDRVWEAELLILFQFPDRKIIEVNYWGPASYLSMFLQQP
jgi:hypothetical protein